MRKVEGLRGAVMVTRAGSVVLDAAAGPADARVASACTADTRFQIASISKQFAAIAVLLLAERGAVRPDEPITRWFPSCDGWRGITLHHLLTHTSGIGHWSDIAGYVVSQSMDLDERIDLLQRAPLLTPPGDRWHYSSPGYILIGHIVAQASGQSYPDFLTEHVLAPLAMTSTMVAASPAGADLARGHRAGEPVPSWDLAMMTGTGDVWSTVTDLARYTAMINAGTLLSAASRQAQLTRHAPIPEQPGAPDRCIRADSYGYGVFIGTIAGHTAYFHPGDNPGYVSFNAWLPDPDIIITVLSNDETTNIDQLVRHLLTDSTER
jgi:CubicO group peptidase (beta-lactamase class C family)